MRTRKIIITVLLFGVVFANAQTRNPINTTVRMDASNTAIENFSGTDNVTSIFRGAEVKSIYNITDSSKIFLANPPDNFDMPINLAVHGKGRGTFTLPSGAQVPFNFDIKLGKNKQRVLYFINGDERFEGGVIHEIGDSLYASLDLFSNILVLNAHGKYLKGYLRKQDGRGLEIPVTLTIGSTARFPARGPTPTVDVSGTYSIVFKVPDGKSEQAVALFQQDGKRLKGTFLRVTGDSRFLEGVVEKDSFRLSSFIGSVPVFYRGRILKDGTLSGEQVGSKGNTPFTGVQNEEAALPDPYRLTYLKNGYTTLDFSFPDVNGKLVSLKDPKYRGKVVIVAISGSWCPNCIDEASFLAPWYKKNHDRGVEIIAIHYERSTDTAFVSKALQRFRNRFNIQYDQVFGGKAEKNVVAASLPALNAFLSFPTTIIIDKQGKVAKIHTGFSGPATGKYYSNFVKEFNEDVNELLKK